MYTERVRESKDELLVIAKPLSSSCNDMTKRTVVARGAAFLSDSVACSLLLCAAVALSSVSPRRLGSCVNDVLHLEHIS